ncbi:hypothetical protein Tco_0948193 [Tanacetum coccineum]
MKSLPKPKSSSSVEDDGINVDIVQDHNRSSSLPVNVLDEGCPKSVKEARGNPIEQVIGDGIDTHVHDDLKVLTTIVEDIATVFLQDNNEE